MSALLDAVPRFFLWLKEAHGLDFSVFYDRYDWDRFTDGLVVTSWLSLACIALSLVVGGTGVALAKTRSRLVQRLNEAFFMVFRYTPPLVQVYFFYFGVAQLLPDASDGFGGREPILGGLALAIISLSLYAGASNYVIFRAGMDSVPRAAIEAAAALGYTRLQAYRQVILPLALRLCLAPLLNNLVNLVKATAMAFAVAVPEVVYMTNQIGADNGNRAEMMTLLLLTYCLIVSVLVFGVGRVERRMRIPGYAA